MSMGNIIGKVNENYFEIFYEDLITNSMNEILELGGFLGIEFKQHHLALHKSLESSGANRNMLKINARNYSKYHELDKGLLLKMEGILLPTMQQLERYNYSEDVQLVELSLFTVIRLYFYDLVKISYFHLFKKMDFSSFLRTFINSYKRLLFKVHRNIN